MRIDEIKMGQKIRTSNNSDLAGWIRNQTGIVRQVRINAFESGVEDRIWITFDPPLNQRDEWFLPLIEAYFVPPLTPEEEAALEDQKRREAHADRWL
jgi:hypothetical protein